MDQLRKSVQTEKSRTKNPSFSSTLLDSIYRSFDEGGNLSKSKQESENLLHFRSESMKKKQTPIVSNSTTIRNKNSFRCILKEEEEKEEDRISISSQRRTCLIDKWMEKKVTSEKLVNVRRKSIPHFDSKLLNNDLSSSSSSDSSSGGGFSSSEAESIHGSRSTRSSCYAPLQKPKPIRTTTGSGSGDRSMGQDIHRKQSKTKKHNNNNKNNDESTLIKTKTRALKIYGDLKKVKTPISPGGKIASFINSIFTPKKSKISSSSSSSIGGGKGTDLRTKSETCSSASSFSRSCLNKNPSSNEKLSNGFKRSVKFYPVSVIVDEDLRPCGHKILDDKSRVMPLTDELMKFHLNDNNNNNNKRMVFEEGSKDLVERKKSNVDIVDVVDDEEDEEDDDGASYASSDLFELDNLGVIGIDRRYTEELPVYETTHFETNRAIANGYIL